MTPPIQFRSCNAIFPYEVAEERRDLLSSTTDSVFSNPFASLNRTDLFASPPCHFSPFSSARLFSEKTKSILSPELIQEIAKKFGEIFPDGRFYIQIPFRPGNYQINANLPLATVKYKVNEGNALLDLRFTEGKITQFKIDFDPPIQIDAHINIPILSAFLFHDGVPRLLKSIYLNIENGKLLSKMENLPNINLTPTFLGYLNGGNPTHSEEFPKTMNELLQALAEMMTKKRETSPNSQTKPTQLPLNFENAKIVRGDLRFRKGENKIGPMIVQTDPFRNNILTIYNSSLSEVNMRIPEFASVRIPLQNNPQAIQLNRISLGFLHFKMRDKIYLSGGKGGIQSAESDLRKINVRNRQLSWSSLSGAVDIITFESTIDLNGIAIASLKGKTPPKAETDIPATETAFDFSNIRGRKASLVYLAGKGATIGLENTEIDLNQASGKNMYGEAELDPTHLKNTDVQVKIGFVPEDPNDYSVDLGIKTSSSLFRLKRGVLHLPGFDEKTRKEGYSFGFNSSTISDFEFGIEKGRMQVKGKADFYLSHMLVRLGSGMDLPFKTNLTLRNAKVTGYLEDLLVLNLFDRNPANLQLSARGNLRLLSEGGKGDISSNASVNRFRLVTDDLGVESHLQSFSIYNGLIQALEVDKTVLRLGKLHGKVSSFQHYGTELEDLSFATVGFDHFKIDLEKLRAYQQRGNSGDLVKLGSYQVYPIGEFRKFDLQLYAHSHKNEIYLKGEPDDDDQKRDKKLFSRSVNASIRQQDQIVIAYDPNGRKVKQFFLGKGPALFLESDGTALLRNFIPD